MPKVTDAYRAARRDEIAHAAVRVLRRRGLSNTSIADIVDEADSSAGAIYSHFANKADLARYVAREVISWRIERLADLTRELPAPSPAEIVQFVLEELSDEMPIDVALQFWSEATVDPAMHEAVRETVALLRGSLTAVVQPYAVAHSATPADADVLVASLTKGMIAVCQGYIVGVALNGHIPPADYLANVGLVFTPPSPAPTGRS